MINGRGIITEVTPIPATGIGQDIIPGGITGILIVIIDIDR